MRKKLFLFVFVFAALLFSPGCSKTNTQSSPQTPVPVLTSSSVTAITSSTAISGGLITSDEGFTITERGVCWSTVQKPTTADSKTIDSSGTGSFNSLLTGLTAKTVYFERAYATNAAGTAYGNEASFITKDPVLPKVTTTLKFLQVVTEYDPNDIPYNLWEYGGSITDNGGLKITDFGIILYNYYTKSTKRIPFSTTNSSFTNLIYEVKNIGWLYRGQPNYSVQAYATNSLGTGYGTVIPF
jgi:hypothetical protein